MTQSPDVRLVTETSLQNWYNSLPPAEPAPLTGDVTAFDKVTQAEYDALAVKDPTTLYLIPEGA